MQDDHPNVAGTHTVFVLKCLESLFPSKLESEDKKYRFAVTTFRNSRGRTTIIYRQPNEDSHRSNEGGTRIASVDWNYPDGDNILRLGDADSPPQKLEHWIRRPWPLFKPGYTFMASDAQQYRWVFSSSSIVGVEAKLYSKNDTQSPIASAYTKSPGRGYPQLILEPEALEIMESAIISYVLLQCENLLLTHTVYDMAIDAYNVKDNPLVSWGRKSSKSSVQSNPTPRGSEDADAASVYASSTTGLIRRRIYGT